jgi:hypothetical protein
MVENYCFGLKCGAAGVGVVGGGWGLVGISHMSLPLFIVLFSTGFSIYKYSTLLSQQFKNYKLL